MEKTEIRPDRISPTAFLLATACLFALKFGVLLQLHDHPLLQPGGGLDSDYYSRLAQRVAQGDLLLGPGLYFVSPLYIYFLGALLAAGCSLFAIKVVQIALGTLACALVWQTSREWFGQRAAWLAFALAGLTGLFTFYEVLILQAALDPFLTALDLWLLTRAIKGDSPPSLAGAALAIHALNRPNMLIVAAGVAAALALTRPAGLRKAGLLGVGLAIGFAPVTVRNYAVTGTWTPVPSHGGLNLYIGNNPNADGTYRSVDGITPNIEGQAADARRVAVAAERRALTDAEVSAHFTRRAFAWMREHPTDAARLFVRKVTYTVNWSFLSLNYSYPFYREESPILRWLGVGPLVLIPLGLVGLFVFSVRGEPRPAGYGVFAATVPLLIVSIAAFFVASRYRVPLLVPLCVTAGALLDVFIRAWNEARSPRVAIAVICVVVVGVFTIRDLHLDDARAEEQTRMAVWLAANGRGSEAEQRLSRIAPDYPLLGVTHFRVGQAFAQAGRPRDAVLHYEQAVRIDPKERAPRAALARASTELGLSLAQQGNDEEALRHLSRAAELSPTDAPAHLNLAVQLARVERFTDARASAERALAIEPSYDRARAFLAVLDRAGK